MKKLPTNSTSQFPLRCWLTMRVLVLRSGVIVLNIEMSRAREYRHEDEIAVSWIPSVEQLADPLTNKTANSLEIIRTFQEGSKPRRKIGEKLGN